MKRIITLTVTIVLLVSHAVFSQGTKQAVKQMLRGQYTASIALLEKSVRQNPALTEAAYWLSIAYIQNNEPQKALSFLEQSSQQSKPLLQAALANVYAVMDNDAKATALLGSVNTDPGLLSNVQLAAAMGRSYSAMDDFVKAENYYQRAVAINPSNPENYLLLSYNAARHRDASIEESYLDKALQLDSNFAPAWYHKAAICLAKKDMKMYIVCLNKTVAGDSLFVPAWKDLYEYAYTHKTSDLEKNYRHYLESCDKNGEQEYELLTRMFNEDKYAMVLKKVSALVQKERNEVVPDLYRLAACSYYQLKKPAEAYHEMVRYLQVQDVKRVSSYDKYLTAAFASQLSSMDTDAVRYIETAFTDDSLLAERKYFSSVLINHFIKARNRHAVAVWKEKALPYKDWDEQALYQAGMNWYELDKLQHADSLFTLLVQKHPNAYKGIFMRAIIHSVTDSAMTKGTAVPFYESFIEKTAKSQSKESESFIKQSYEYLGHYYLVKKDYSKSLYNYNKLAAYQPVKKGLHKTINRLNRYIKTSG